MKKITCIIVDDEVEARDRLEMLLNKIENIELLCKVEEADDAVKKIIVSEPDIVFIDVEMPVKNGFDVVKKVREAECMPTFIFVTAFNQYAIKAIKNAAFDYLIKPVDIDELKQTIERYKSIIPTETASATTKDENIKKINLSEREKGIIKLLAKGKTSKDIAEVLFISKNTVDTHRRNILEKTGLKSTAELINFAFTNKLI